MIEGIISLVVGLVIGLVLVVWLMRVMVSNQVDNEFEKWRSRELYAVRRDALDEARPAVQRRVGTAIANWTHSFPFLQEDSRFIGHPIDYIVFEGYSDVRSKRDHQISSVTFVRARREGRADPEGSLVEECIRLGRVEWLTLEVGTPATKALPVRSPS